MGNLKFLIYFCVCVGSIGCQRTPGPCLGLPGVKLNASSTEQFITSPGFSDNYADDLNCSGTIRNPAGCGLIRIDVKLLDLEQENDKLRLRYGSSSTEKYVVTTSEHIIPSESVTIRFTSDGSNTHSGFILSYSIT
ncbi:CUB and sushi domain-containing protein 3-like, partial [Mizuhopecten yessoensis]|uniref:CUB and sushi domain-containing protein 3-like n=1 Tax=Mizuhopecten yessoensis TaxID=6573 RepID=UPI000B45CED3